MSVPLPGETPGENAFTHIELHEQGDGSVTIHPRTAHACPLPFLPFSMIVSQRPDWECGNCGRIYRHEIPTCGGGGWWTEVRGPLL